MVERLLSPCFLDILCTCYIIIACIISRIICRLWTWSLERIKLGGATRAMRMLISTASCLCMPKIYPTSSHLRISLFAVSLSSNTWDGGRSVAAGFVAPGAEAPARPAHAAGANSTILRTGECLACTPAASEASRKEESRISTQRYAARCHATTWPGGRYVSGHAIGMDELNTTCSQLHVNIGCGRRC